MMRSLFAGVSGLKNHQVKMDVIGNNIANINTVAFKAGRVTFQESLNQTLKDATRSHSGKGGINPQQVGLGMSIGSIDTLFTQGNLETTGNTTDLAIQGDAFFVLSDGVGEYYSRAGNFVVDGDGRLVAPKNGYVVQGKLADSSGSISSGSQIQDIVLPFGQKSPARATSQIDYQCNLDSNTYATQQTWTADFSKRAEITSGVLTIDNDNVFSIVEGANDTITIDSNITDEPADLKIDAGDYYTVAELTNAINVAINNDSTFRGHIQAEVIDDNKIQLFTTKTGGQDTYLQLSGNLIDGTGNTVSWDDRKYFGTVTKGIFDQNDDDTIDDTDAGTSLNELSMVSAILDEGDGISISGTNPDGTVIEDSDGNQIQFTFGSTDDGYDGTTVEDLVDKINDAIVGATASLTDEGKIAIIDDLTGESQTTLSLTFEDQGTNSTIGIPTFTTAIEGRDAGTHTASITTYDSKGGTHIVSLTFTNVSTETVPNVWTWEAIVDDGETETGSGESGEVRFNSDGSLAVFTIADGKPLTFTPANGADIVSINLNGGAAGSLAGITQLDSPTTTVAKNQDGYGMGNLQTISVAENGEITGHFSNGVSQTLAQIVMAKFNNPAGLLREGDNMYKDSANSGTAVKGTIGGGIQASLASGALEMSNVDLAEEFTDMIVAQRGFQANSRVITTADTLLQEITQLKRS